MSEDAKNILNLDTLLTKDRCLNTKRINKLFKQYDLDYLEGDSPVEKTYLLYKDRTYCEVCGKPTSFISWAAGYKKYCSKKCFSQYMRNSTKNYRAHCTEEDEARRLEKYRQTCLEKFGVPSASQCREIQDKIKATTLERYGCENASQSEEIKKKKEDTLLSKYGKTNPFEIPEVQERIKQTNIEKYGYDNPFKDPNFHKNLEERNLKLYGRKTVTPLEEIQKKSRETMLKKYGVEYYSQSSEVKKKIAQTWEEKISEIEKEFDCTSLNTLLDEYGTGWYQNESFPIEVFKKGGLSFVSNKELPLIQKYVTENPGNRSHAEIEVLEYCKSLLPNEEIVSNTKKVIKSRNDNCAELDIYIPSKGIAIEYNGPRWHAEDKTKQLHKTEECEKLGIRLLHIWDDLWRSKKTIYKSIIASSLGIYERRIYARKCECKEISSNEYQEFLNKNHIQGPVNSSLRLGLFYQGELVQVAGWGKSRFKKDEYELHRMCSLLNTQVIGGFSKLIKHSNLDTFISYVDRSLYNGKGYISCGFEILDKTPPGYFYWLPSKGRLSRMQAQKHKLKNILEDYDANLSELENLHKNGWVRVYDCGNYKVRYDKRRVKE